MHQHHWDAWLHFPLAVAWMTMWQWVNWLNIDGIERHVTFLVGVTVGLLQIAYLIRKHWDF